MMRIVRKPKKTIKRKKREETPLPDFDANRHPRSLLVHSFLYYKLDENVIDDTKYDQLYNLVRDNLDDIPDTFPFKDCLLGMGGHGSMYDITTYPAPIAATALRVLHHHKTQHGMTEEPFHIFITRYGFHIEKGDLSHAKTEDPPHQPSSKRVVRKRRPR